MRLPLFSWLSSIGSLLLPGTPSAPRKLVQTQHITQIVNLTWSVPLTDGGKELTACIVEYKPPATQWHMAATEKTEQRWFRFEGRKMYDARVRAENEIGVGPPSEVIRIQFTGGYKVHNPPTLALRLLGSLVPRKTAIEYKVIQFDVFGSNLLENRQVYTR